jgi:hypothetical protein
VSVATATGGASQTVQRQLTGGNPGAFRAITHTLPPVTGSATAVIVVHHVFLGNYYIPSFDGAIDHIDYAEDGILPDLSWPEEFSTTQPLIEQANRTFVSSRFVRFIGNTTWQRQTLSGLKAADFVASDGSGDHPDFSSSGGTMIFGFARTNTRSATLPPVPANQDLVIEQGVDNWTVTLSRAASQPPVANNDTVVIERCERDQIDVLANDTDPGGFTLQVVNHTAPNSGNLFQFFESFNYHHRGPGIVDGFDYTISNGTSTDTASVLLLIDCGCAISCAGLCAAKTATDSGRPRGTESFDLGLIYRVRDELFADTESGRRYIDYYYRSNPEILKILLLDQPALGTEAVNTVVLLQPLLRDLLDSEGTAPLQPEHAMALDAFLDKLSIAASAPLQQLIATERARIGPLNSLIGLPVAQVATHILGVHNTLFKDGFERF